MLYVFRDNNNSPTPDSSLHLIVYVPDCVAYFFTNFCMAFTSEDGIVASFMPGYVCTLFLLKSIFCFTLNVCSPSTEVKKLYINEESFSKHETFSFNSDLETMPFAYSFDI